MPLPVAKPQPGEYPSSYETYIRLIPAEADIFAVFAEQEAELAAYFSQLTEEQAAHRYAEGKWSLKQLLGHVTDTERIMAYRLLCVSRGDQTPLPGFDENTYVRGAAFESRVLSDLLAEFVTVRHATVALVRGLSPEQLQRVGTANGGGVSAAGLVYMIAGHARHHLNIVRERYVPGMAPR
jgi:uncharacterized damage-inducible protein DinB